jgi:hypothetical protein
VGDEKVSDRGVRVRCSACKTVFAVRKSGTEPNSAASEKKRVPAARAAPNPPPATEGAGDDAGKRLAADDLFGMSELTGESTAPSPPDPATVPTPHSGESVVIGRLSTPLGAGFASHSQPSPSPAIPSRPAVSPVSAPEPRLPTPLPEPAPKAAKAEEPDPFDGLSLTDRSGLSAAATAAAARAASAGSPSKKEEPDPFDGLSLTDRSGLAATATAAAAQATRAPTPKKIDRLPTPAPVPVRKRAEEPAPPPRRALVASALTGVVLAAVVLVVLLFASLFDGAIPSWLSLGAPSDVVATRIRSGLYETATGKPVFFVRGRVENRGKTARGPVRVVAELVGRSGADARAEAIAGVEPSVEDVYALRSGGDADKLARALSGSEGDRRIQPGSSLPFFAVIADPPADLARHKLVVRVEPQEAPGAPRSAEGPR